MGDPLGTPRGDLPDHCQGVVFKKELPGCLPWVLAVPCRAALAFDGLAMAAAVPQVGGPAIGKVSRKVALSMEWPRRSPLRYY